MPQNMNISSYCTIGKHAYGTCLNGYAHFSSLFLCAINVAIFGTDYFRQNTVPLPLRAVFNKYNNNKAKTPITHLNLVYFNS